MNKKLEYAQYPHQNKVKFVTKSKTMQEVTQFFYESTFPKEGDLVIVQIKSQEDFEILVSLKEYGEIEGHIPTFLHRGFKKQKYRTNSIHVGSVMNIEKGLVNISLKNIDEDEKKDKRLKYSKAN